MFLMYNFPCSVWFIGKQSAFVYLPCILHLAIIAEVIWVLILFHIVDVFHIFYIDKHLLQDSFISSFPTYKPFISCSCLIALARKSSTVSKRSDESRHPCCVPEISGNTSSFLPLSMLIVDSLYWIEAVCFQFLIY